MSLKINIVGAGKLGQTIARLIVKNGLAKIAGVFNTNIENAKRAIAFIGEGQPYCNLKLMSATDINLIATPDERIEEVCKVICHNGDVQPGHLFIHCSGLLSSDLLSSVKEKGGFVASIHPMKSFANPELSVENYPGTFCAMEGDSEALNIIAPIFQDFGSLLYPIHKDKKPHYHAAGVFASNYLVTLAEQATICAQAAGIEENVALQMILHLMQGSLTNLEKSMSPKEALTGPIKRGDVSTIETHLATLKSDQLRLIYSMLGIATLELTSLDAGSKEKIKQILVMQTELGR